LVVGKDYSQYLSVGCEDNPTDRLMARITFIDRLLAMIALIG